MSELRYKDLYNSSPVLHRTLDEKGIILDCNDAYAKSLGLSKDEIIGKSIYDHVSVEHISSMKESFVEWKKIA